MVAVLRAVRTASRGDREWLLSKWKSCDSCKTRTDTALPPIRQPIGGHGRSKNVALKAAIEESLSSAVLASGGELARFDPDRAVSLGELMSQADRAMYE